MQNGKKFFTLLALCGIFAVAMAYLEATVVVYLREIYYPNGFKFPLVELSHFMLATEIGREFSTLVMLAVLASLISTNRREWFAYFAYSFGVWDIWYYIWLKVLLNWPSSLLDWDILFLIPLPWIGPVLAPVLVSISLIVAAYFILYFENRGSPILLTQFEWLLEILAALIIIGSFLIPLEIVIKRQEPNNFHWWIFMLGWFLGLTIFGYRTYQSSKSKKY